MSAHVTNEYLRNAVLTASSEQLQMMLYDGAIRFARQARVALLAHDWESSCDKLIRAQKITLELQNGLRPEVNPTLCEQLAGLYAFVYRRLIDANVTHDPVAIDEALQILEHQRDTWRLLLDKVQHTQSESHSAPSEIPSPTCDALSVQG